MTKARQAKNILFVMYDQLRWDYLSCAGYPHLYTPNFDWVASQVCGLIVAMFNRPCVGQAE